MTFIGFYTRSSRLRLSLRSMYNDIPNRCTIDIRAIIYIVLISFEQRSAGETESNGLRVTDQCATRMHISQKPAICFGTFTRKQCSLSLSPSLSLSLDMRIAAITITRDRHATSNGWAVIYSLALSRPYSLTSLSLVHPISFHDADATCRS